MLCGLDEIPRRRIRRFTVFACVLALLALFDVFAQQTPPPDDSAVSNEQDTSAPGPRHRIDFGIQWFDAAEGDIVTGSLAYSWVPLAHHSFAAIVPIVGADLGETEGSGIGDLRLQYNYVPSAKLTASPWVPNTLGMGFGLIVPTGDPDKGLGGDRLIAIPTLGWVFVVNERFTLLPTLQYFRSLQEGPTSGDFSSANLGVGFLYVFRSEFWLNYTPSLFRDFDPIDDTNLDHFLTLGKQFTPTFGGSLTLGDIERPPVQDAAVARASDQFAQITLHFVLPW